MSNLSLRSKILLRIMPIVILGMVSLSFIAYTYVNALIEKELSNSMLASVGKSAESINRWLATIMLEPESIASTPAAKRINEDFSTFDHQNIYRHKTLHSKHSDIFQDIYAANRHGEYHTVQKKDDTYSIFVGDIANRPYFRSIMAGGPTQITPPLISRTTGIPTIFVVSPIVDDADQPQGLVGAGISLKYIQQVAERLKAGETGYGFIIAEDGTYISHPDSENVMQRKITDSEMQSKQELGRLMIAGKSGIYRYVQGLREMVAFYQPIPLTGWSVATVLPASELFAPADRMMKLLVMITSVFVVLIGSAILISMQRLIKPLQNLAARAEEISRGNLDGRALPVSANDEIGILSDSFNIMVNSLRETLSELQQSEDNFRGIFEHAIEGIMQSTIQGEILNANPAMAKMLGFASAGELMATYTDLGRQMFVDAADREKILTTLLVNGEVRDTEVRCRRRDGEIIWVSINTFLVRDEAGEPLRIEGLVSDISARKQAENEKEKLSEQLLQSQKLEAVGQLAGGVAHDFNNMLAVILGRAQLALLKLEPTHELYKSLNEIQVAAEHSANLTRQLLAFARKQTVAPRVIDIRQSIHDTYRLLRRLIPEDIELQMHLGEENWLVFFDPDQVGQIITNLCINARDAITGTGRITIETKNTVFDIAYCSMYPGYQPGEYVCLSVSDTGTGMDKETQKHIFEPFFTTKEISKGTGLGLATVYGIIKQNNGFINLYSEPGQGSSFKIYLPRHKGPSETATPVLADSRRFTEMGKVLLVEDEPRLLAISKAMLEELGCEVLAAGTADEAITKAHNHAQSIDLLITDVVMPVMNGRELAAAVEKINPGIKCLYMSGYTADIIAHKGILDTGINLIEKPFSLQTLANKIREVMKADLSVDAEQESF